MSDPEAEPEPRGQSPVVPGGPVDEEARRDRKREKKKRQKLNLKLRRGSLPGGGSQPGGKGGGKAKGKGGAIGALARLRERGRGRDFGAALDRPLRERGFAERNRSSVGRSRGNPDETFQRFASSTRLSAGFLTDWEQDMRQQLVAILEHVRQPMPLVEWINRRIGGEIDTWQDDAGVVMVGLREAPPPEREQRMPPRDARPAFRDAAPPREEAPREREPRLPQDDSKRAEEWFAKLSPTSFSNQEVQLREAVFQFLATWADPRKAILPDMERDILVNKKKMLFIPRCVTLQEWVERRMGEEVVFRRTRSGRDMEVDLTKIGEDIVQEKIRELADGGGSGGKGGRGGKGGPPEKRRRR